MFVYLSPFHMFSFVSPLEKLFENCYLSTEMRKSCFDKVPQFLQTSSAWLASIMSVEIQEKSMCEHIRGSLASFTTSK